MRPLSEELRKANEDTFRAEARETVVREDGAQVAWDVYLPRALADGFTLVRGTGVVQNREQMIAQARPSGTKRATWASY